MAEPTGERWHGSTTPTFGGIGIYCGFVVGVAAAVLAGVLEPTTELLGILGGCTVIFAAGTRRTTRSAFGRCSSSSRNSPPLGSSIALRPSCRAVHERRRRRRRRDRHGSWASRTPSTSSTTWMGLPRRWQLWHVSISPSTRPSSTTMSSSPFSRSRSGSPASASCRSISEAARTPQSSWGTVAASCSGSVSQASGWPRAGPLQVRPSRR